MRSRAPQQVIWNGKHGGDGMVCGAGTTVEVTTVVSAGVALVPMWVRVSTTRSRATPPAITAKAHSIGMGEALR